MPTLDCECPAKAASVDGQPGTGTAWSGRIDSSSSRTSDAAMPSVLASVALTAARALGGLRGPGRRPTRTRRPDRSRRRLRHQRWLLCARARPGRWRRACVGIGLLLTPPAAGGALRLVTDASVEKGCGPPRFRRSAHTQIATRFSSTCLGRSLPNCPLQGSRATNAP